MTSDADLQGKMLQRGSTFDYDSCCGKSGIVLVLHNKKNTRTNGEVLQVRKGGESDGQGTIWINPVRMAVFCAVLWRISNEVPKSR